MSTQDATSPENDDNPDDTAFRTPPSSPVKKTHPEKGASKDDPLFIAEDPGSSNPSSPAPSTDKGNNSKGSSDRTESEVNLQNFY